MQTNPTKTKLHEQNHTLAHAHTLTSHKCEIYNSIVLQALSETYKHVLRAKLVGCTSCMHSLVNEFLHSVSVFNSRKKLHLHNDFLCVFVHWIVCLLQFLCGVLSMYFFMWKLVFLWLDALVQPCSEDINYLEETSICTDVNQSTQDSLLFAHHFCKTANLHSHGE